MPSIKSLPEEAINQISAGEVVERPSHLIKELVENSLDAGSTEISLDFDQGGSFVKLSDNGQGIPKEEILLALSRHATSKIRSAEDLSCLKTYGFRGEALAGISAVSDLTLISRTKDSPSGFKLRRLFGKKAAEEELSSVSAPVGSTVIVRSLFENMPARRKFLKSEGAESSSIKSTLKALAISRPEIHFRILQKGKLLFYWPGQKDLLKRLEQVLNIKDLYHIQGQKGPYHLEAAISAPNKVLRNRKTIYLFVSNRWVESPVMQAGLMSAYRGLLMRGEYPPSVLRLEGPGSAIDVNVHPAKSQIRFKDSSLVFQLIENSIRSLLEKAPWAKSPSSSSSSDKHKEQALKFRAKGFGKTQFQLRREEYKRLPSLAWDPKKAQKIAGLSAEAPLFTQTETAEEKKGEERQKSAQRKEEAPSFWSSLQVLAQAHLTYMVCQSDSALVFIDQHAAHERVLYERLFDGWKRGGVEIQSHLIPFSLDLEEGQVEALLKQKEGLKQLGVLIEPFGPGSLAIQSSPHILKETALREGLLLLARQSLEFGDSFAFEKAVSDLCATLACHSAVRAGKPMEGREMEDLLAQMDEFPLSGFCPHGRPVFVEYPLSRLEKDFGRRL